MPSAAKADKDVSESLELNFGAHVDIFGPHIDLAMETAKNSNLEWIAINVDWARLQPSHDQKPNSQQLENALNLASVNQLKIMISITNAPDWAMAEIGPDYGATSRIIQELLSKYDAIYAVELFPGANTLHGWGTIPNPNAYMAVLITANKIIKQYDRPIKLIVGGFSPTISEYDIPESTYLENLYQLQGKTLLSIISIRYPNVAQDILVNPIPENQSALRRYETLRNVMINNNHPNGLIWISQFSWPNEAKFTTGQQSGWLITVYNQIKTHLYIQATFFNQLNPQENINSSENFSENSFISSDGKIHPGIKIIKQLMSQKQQELIPPSILSRLLSPRYLNRSK